MVDSTGIVIEYVYDEVGNMLEIKRSTVTGLAIFDFNPKQGPVGTPVTIQGQEFSPTPSENTVAFNGVTAPISSATDITLVVTVPPGATTGPILVTVAGQTATSNQDFTVTTLPVITSIEPRFALQGALIPNFQVFGINLTGATFSFTPAFPPPDGALINSVAIDPSGTSAMLDVTVGTGAPGQFVLVATNADGSSDVGSSRSNTLTIFDPDNAEADADGDGFPNGLEVILGSDPFDPNSVPDPVAQITEAVGSTFSILNTEPGPTALPGEAVSPLLSILNTEPSPTALPGEAAGAIFSILNTENPTGPADLPGEAVGPTFSIENQGSP